MSDDIAYTYQPKTNPGTEQHPASIAGVPLRDLTEADVQELPRHLRRSLAASDMYQATDAGTKIERADARAVKADEQAAQAEPDATATDAPAERSVKRNAGSADAKKET